MAITLDAIEHPPGSGSYQSFGEATDYGGRFMSSNPYGGMTGRQNESVRPGQTPSLNSISVDGRTIPIRFYRNTGGSTSNADFHANLSQWFGPEKRNASGDTTRKLRCLWHDGSTQIFIPVNVASVQLRPDAPESLDVTVRATYPYFQAVTAATQENWLSDSPVNAGNADAPVLLTIDGGQSPDNAWYFQITNTGSVGVTNVPVVLDVGANLLTVDADVYVFDQWGASKRFFLDSGNRYIWTTCTVDAGETIYFYVIDWSGFDNPKAGTMNWGNFYTTNTANTSQETDGFMPSANPARDGLWFLNFWEFVGGGGSSWGAEVAEGATSMVLTVRDEAAKARNDANGIGIVTGLAADSITGLSRVTANHTSDIRSFVRYRQANAAGWQDAWTQTGNATVTTTITLVDAVEVAVGIEVTGDTPTDGATLTLSGTGTPDITVNLDTAKDLTVSRANLTFAQIVDGAITNSTTGQVITFNDLIYLGLSSGNEELYLDFRHDATARISTNRTAGSGFRTLLGDENAIQFSDPIQGMRLAPGTNTTSETLTAAVLVDWRDTYE